MVKKYTKNFNNRLKKVQASAFVTFCICFLLSVSACTSRDIYYDKKFNPPVYFGSHVVREGDTLYSIAWRYGREFRELAEANNIKPPFLIKPGQKIRLEKELNGRSEKPSRVDSGNKKKVNVTEGKETNEIRKNVTKIKKHKKFKNIKWQWPHVGPILAKYQYSTSKNSRQGVNKGIDIGGEVGDSILAAASGEVVYAGNGLLGYGNLVIINHDARYLSAYAHNKRILVQEGQTIKQGQKIAEMGASGVDRPMLHFEIRLNGQPVNPLKYLPKK